MRITMSAYAIVETGGKQIKFMPGKTYNIEKLESEEGKTVNFDRVLVGLSEKGEFKIGQPYLAKVTVKATVVKQFKDKKIRVVKFKRRKNYLRTHGHRQMLTQVKIEKIEGL
ncbi:MAG: 50S ribosomal protein L21 [Pseudomonadota bacterium]|nr:50S ribosomal protein L21 [Pseudomonadota bacterium]